MCVFRESAIVEFMGVLCAHFPLEITRQKMVLVFNTLRVSFLLSHIENFRYYLNNLVP